MRFHSCGTSPFEPAPVCINVLYEEDDGPPSLMEALCDVEACLIWMQEVHGPCELTVCKPGGEYWEEAGPEELLGEHATKAPRLRSGESRKVALIQRAYWECGEPEVAVVACSGSYVGYRFAAHFPRLDALVNNGCVIPSPSPSSSRSKVASSEPASTRSPRLAHAKKGPMAAASASVGGGSSRVGRRTGCSTVRADGFVLGTSGVVASCASFMHRGHTSWEVPKREEGKSSYAKQGARQGLALALSRMMVVDHSVRLRRPQASMVLI